MAKKKIIQIQPEDMQENNEDISIPEENLIPIKETEPEVVLPKSKKYVNFVTKQKDQYAEEVRNIIRNELINYEKHRQNLKLERKQREEQLRLQKENEELLHTVRKLRDFGLNPEQVIQETRVVNQKNITQKKCIFCHNSFNKNNLTRHMNVCLHNPDSKSHQFLKSKKKLEEEKKIKQRQVVEDPVEDDPQDDYEEPEPEPPKRGTPRVRPQSSKFTVKPNNKQNNKQNDDDEIW